MSFRKVVMGLLSTALLLPLLSIMRLVYSIIPFILHGRVSPSVARLFHGSVTLLFLPFILTVLAFNSLPLMSFFIQVVHFHHIAAPLLVLKFLQRGTGLRRSSVLLFILALIILFADMISWNIHTILSNSQNIG